MLFCVKPLKKGVNYQRRWRARSLIECRRRLHARKCSLSHWQRVIIKWDKKVVKTERFQDGGFTLQPALIAHFHKQKNTFSLCLDCSLEEIEDHQRESPFPLVLKETINNRLFLFFWWLLRVVAGALCFPISSYSYRTWMKNELFATLFSCFWSVAKTCSNTQ